MNAYELYTKNSLKALEKSLALWAEVKGTHTLLLLLLLLLLSRFSRVRLCATP